MVQCARPTKGVWRDAVVAPACPVPPDGGKILIGTNPSFFTHALAKINDGVGIGSYSCTGVKIDG